MKQYIPIIGCFTGLLLLATSPLQAQSDARTRSRLEMGRSTSSAKTVLTRGLPSPGLSLLNPMVNGLDRSVNKNSAVNALFYRSLLSPSQSTTRTQVVEAASTQSSETRPSSSTEETLQTARVEKQVVRTENKMFANDQIVVSNIYPNPAVSGFADIDYQLLTPVGEAKLVLVNIVGAQVGEYTLDPHDRKVRISTHNMPNGLYYYQLSLDGHTVATKKLLVRQQ